MFSVMFTACKRSLGQGNIFSSVCQEFCPQGGLPQCILGYQPHHHPGADTPRDQAPPRNRYPLEQTPPKQTSPGADPPPQAVHAGRHGQQAGGMHPTGMQSCCVVCLSVHERGGVPKWTSLTGPYGKHGPHVVGGETQSVDAGGWS